MVTFWINVNLIIRPQEGGVARWFLLCNLFYFAIGIFLVKKGCYLKWKEKTGVISFLGELSFFVFLYHMPLIPIASNAGILVYLAMLAGISTIAMIVDEKIQKTLRSLNLSSLRSTIST